MPSLRRSGVEATPACIIARYGDEIVSAEHLPLSDVRVVDFSWAMAGPQGTRLLADFGADVIRVESSEHPDLARSAFGPHPLGRKDLGLNSSGYFNHFNRNKRSITLNMQQAAAREVAEELIRISDVVIENYAAGVMTKWGLTYERMRELREDIIYISMAGPGHRGPYRDHRTFGPTVQALSGLTHLSGLPDREPAGWGFSYMDHSGGYAAATAILMALYRRGHTGEGEWVDLSQIEAAIALTGTVLLDHQVNGRPSPRLGNRAGHPAAAPHGIYRCADSATARREATSKREDQATARREATSKREEEDDLDRWVAIACYTDDQWDALSGILGVEGYATVLERLEHHDELDEIIEGWTRPQTPHDVQKTLQRAGVPAGAVQNNRDLAERDEQLAHRGIHAEITHPLLGTYLTDGTPPKLSRTPASIRSHGPLLGEHTDEVLIKMLGYSPERVTELREAGALQ